MSPKIIGMILIFGTAALGGATVAGAAAEGRSVATIEQKATLPILVPEDSRTQSECNCVVVVETAGVSGNTDRIPLTGKVVLKVGEGAKEQRVDLGHFFVFGSQSELPENYAFDVATNPEVTPSILQAMKAGRAEAEVTISPPQPDWSKATSIRLPISKSYLQVSQ